MKVVKRGTRVVGMRKIVLTRVANSESESTKGSRRVGGREGGRKIAPPPPPPHRSVNRQRRRVRQSVGKRRGATWLFASSLDNDDDDNDVDRSLLPGVLDDEHEDASRRRAFRMTKAKETEGICPVTKCGAAVDGDEKVERK